MTRLCHSILYFSMHPPRRCFYHTLVHTSSFLPTYQPQPYSAFFCKEYLPHGGWNKNFLKCLVWEAKKPKKNHKVNFLFIYINNTHLSQHFCTLNLVCSPDQNKHFTNYFPHSMLNPASVQFAEHLEKVPNALILEPYTYLTTRHFFAHL